MEASAKYNPVAIAIWWIVLSNIQLILITGFIVFSAIENGRVLPGSACLIWSTPLPVSIFSLFAIPQQNLARKTLFFVVLLAIGYVTLFVGAIALILYSGLNGIQ